MTDDWLAWRKQGITASDVAMAVSGRYGGSYAVVARKLGITAEQEQTADMARGLALEERIQTAAETLRGLYIVGEQLQVEHGQRAVWRATLDGLASPVPEPTIDDCTHVVEVKTRGVDVRPAWDYWRPQTQWQMLVTGIAKVLLCEAAVGTDDDGEPEIVGMWLHVEEADADYQAGLADLADELWWRVEERDLPTPDAGALEMVKAVNSVVSDTADAVDLTELADDVARFAAIRQAQKEAKVEADALEARIRQAVGGATHGQTPTHTVTVSKPRRVLTDAGRTALLAARPDLARPDVDTARARKDAKALYESLTEPVGARTITIKETK